jgi:hypothetical protein
MTEPVENAQEKPLECPVSETGRSRFKRWLRRVGVIGFLFFLIKGLLWLIVPYLLAKGFFRF